ncbi:hypothetical protein SAMN05444156_2173 [Verrucomicrobium sp. GAS474]|nr:hypothetical protein SAMN05444156_2173 [Verrucomicrobium sp. GAS474]
MKTTDNPLDWASLGISTALAAGLITYLLLT